MRDLFVRDKRLPRDIVRVAHPGLGRFRIATLGIGLIEGLLRR